MTNSSSDEEKLSEEEREKIYVETGVDEEAGLKALLTDLSKLDCIPLPLFDGGVGQVFFSLFPLKNYVFFLCAIPSGRE